MNGELLYYKSYHLSIISYLSFSLMQGVFENYLQQKMPDPNLNGIVEATQWFCFSDTVQRQINQLQNYTVYPYLQYGFVIWHMLFATLAWPKITFPTKSFEVSDANLNVCVCVMSYH